MSGYNPFSNIGYDGSTLHNTDRNTGQDASMMGDDMGSPVMMGGQSLDDIVDQNAKFMRRQSMPQTYRHRDQNHMGNMTGMNNMANMNSMMEFSSGAPAGPLDDFAFDPATSLSHDEAGNLVPRLQHSDQQLLKKRVSMHNISNVASPFTGSTMNANYGPMMGNAASSYQSPAGGSNLDMDMNSPFVTQSMGMHMNFNDSSMASMQNNGTQHMNAHSSSTPYSASMVNSPMNNMPGSIHGSTTQDRSGGAGSQMIDSRRPYHGSLSARRHSIDSNPGQLARSQSARITPQHTSSAQTQRPQQPQPHSSSRDSNNQHQSDNGRFDAQSQHPAPGSKQDKGMHNPVRQGPGISEDFNPTNHNSNKQTIPWEAPEGGWPSTMVGKPHMQSVYKNAYSSTGFDMLGVLMRVATRPNPEISLGSVDLSCAFVVCDAEKDDFPIIYCSENFERLTGYTRHMILGRNCRFLQSPDGNVAPGIKRRYVDDDSVLYLKNMINARREAQISLINYRRGGQPFMNLLTMIPISWETDQVKFFVGFQVDLVEQPNAVTSRNPDGSYTVNYQRGMTMPRYVMNAPESTNKVEFGQTISRDEVSTILSTIGGDEPEYTKRMWDKVLLENTDDVVHVLSLKGLFQWVSPASLRVLEYEPGELIGTALSSVCHPSDIVPVTRELKDTSTGATVNVVFRIRRKNSGYMWFEGHGSLHTEQGKGRKSIIMVGRERPVYTLSKLALSADGGIGEYELWSKMSTAGMFLFVSSNVRQLLDRQPEDLVGISIQSLMRSESKQEFGRMLELTRQGKKASVKHELINRRGQVLQAFTTLYPGDATEGLKPTFILAQTRLIKFSRTNPTKPPPTLKHERSSNESVASVNTNNQQLVHGSQGGTTPNSKHSISQYMATDTKATTYSGHQGLQLGKQDEILASDDNLFDELKTTKSSSWQYEIRQLEKRNRMLAEEVQSLLAAKKKRKRRKGTGMQQKDCANCHTRVTPEWRRGPSGQRDLCNSCGLRWAKLNGRVSPRTNSTRHSDAASEKASSASPRASFAIPDSNGHQGQQRPLSSTSISAQQAGTTAQHGPEFYKHGDGHAAQMEGAGGVPEKIDEGIEPD